LDIVALSLVQIWTHALEVGCDFFNICDAPSECNALLSCWTYTVTVT